MLKVFKKVGHGFAVFGRFVARLFTDAAEVQKVIDGMTGEQKTAMLNLFGDTLAFAAAAEAALSVGGTSIPLDGALVVAIKKLITDARDGVVVAEKLFAALGIELSK